MSFNLKKFKSKIVYSTTFLNTLRILVFYNNIYTRYFYSFGDISAYKLYAISFSMKFVI